MRSSINFVMHPDDEAEFARVVMSEHGTVFVDGPRWRSPEPPIVSDLQEADSYLMIWNPSETVPLTTKHYNNDGTESWYCQNQFVTIQFLRSGLQDGEPPFLFTGRIAANTTDQCKTLYDAASAPSVEKRYNALRKQIKKTYTNSVLIWQDRTLPRSATNPGKPDASLWVGPHALPWLRADPMIRRVQQFKNAGASCWLVDLVGR